MINHVTGPNGNWTRVFYPSTVDLLERMGFIQKEGPVEEELGTLVQYWVPLDTPLTNR